MFQTKPNLLILDEPTNHMDMVGKEALEQMLRNYQGTVLFVSHDRYFVKQVATEILEFGVSDVTQYHCGYDEYLLEKEKRSGMIDGKTESGKKGALLASEVNKGLEVASKSPVQEPTLKDVFDKKSYYNPGKIKSRLQKQLEKYEKQLAESEEKAKLLQLQLLDPQLASDYPKLMELQELLSQEEQKQESLLERMMETELELAEI